MLISGEKRKNNIAEYIIYMWQVEDTIRAFRFDIDMLDRDLVSKYDQPGEVRKEIREWYENIAAHMKNEKVEHSGHVQFLRNIVNELYNFHLSLLQRPERSDYREAYSMALPLIREMNARQNWSAENEVETCLNAVYIYMMMRLKKEHVSAGTAEGMDMFIRLLSLLSELFRAHEEQEQ